MPRTRDGSTPLLVAAAIVVCGLALVLVAARGVPRADSALGHGLGVVGYLLMLFAAFGQSWRKNPRHRGPGPMRTWLVAHVAAGIAGPVLILVHSGFAFRGLAGVTTALMLVVVASGVVGRYAYTRAPGPSRLGTGDELRRLDAEIAALEGEAGMDTGRDFAGGGTATATRRAHDPAIEAQVRTLVRLRAEHERRMRSAQSRGRARKTLAVWWALHVPLSGAMLVLGLVHALAALFYRT